ncbi:AraC-like DNA-binding protein [Pseudoduganella flava]|uniref:AraC-like DNA-binding protein n=1 Tax=Pseudoduganella flava TaxID=871742 RepID=A0A562PKJ6_9BURK|nr:AraC family transcriptional regulator [Pseudoduganella flava]QGZ42373.1 helix-turn-helix domain-containing protein [Pseudoduganella flava]TWI44937.1 AraC-like DNA-binding protein [Pseudoduganella flava]
MIDKLADILKRHAPHDGAHATALSRVHVLRSVTPTEPIPVIHQPAVCFIAQGRKQTMLGEQAWLYAPRQFLIVSAELPITGQVLDASAAAPYLCLRLDLDPATIATVIEDAAPNASADDAPAVGVAVSSAPPQLLDAVVRLAGLLDASEGERRFLAPPAEREILYRLLMGEQSDRLRQIAYADSKLARINRAIVWIKSNYARTLRVEEMAAQVNMSTSSFHEHFRTVTSMSPLQYQKQIRLQEARRLMLAQALDAATAGFQVGYESPSQFSREYARRFGLPPKRDIEKIRALPVFA